LQLYRRSIIIMVVIFCSLGLYQKSWSFMEECQIRTEIVNHAGIDKHNLLVRFEYADDGRELSRKYFEQKQVGETAIVSLNFTDAGIVTLLDMVGKVMQRGNNGFLIRPGFSLPVDIIPVMSAGGSHYYSVVRKTQGIVFKRNFKLSVQEVSRVEMRKLGFNIGDFDVSEKLLMYRIVDNSENLVLMQIREKGAEMWLYEETKLRRSWRLN